MLEIDLDDEVGRCFWLWRLMIAAGERGKGYGAAALQVAFAELRRRGASEVYSSWVAGDGGPEGFYRKLGFQPTGEIDDGEIVARLALS